MLVVGVTPCEVCKKPILKKIGAVIETDEAQSFFKMKHTKCYFLELKKG